MRREHLIYAAASSSSSYAAIRVTKLALNIRPSPPEDPENAIFHSNRDFVYKTATPWLLAKH